MLRTTGLCSDGSGQLWPINADLQWWCRRLFAEVSISHRCTNGVRCRLYLSGREGLVYGVGAERCQTLFPRYDVLTVPARQSVTYLRL